MTESQIINKFGHYEVYVDGEFMCSADTLAEAARELEEVLEERRRTELWMENF